MHINDLRRTHRIVIAPDLHLGSTVGVTPRNFNDISLADFWDWYRNVTATPDYSHWHNNTQPIVLTEKEIMEIADRFPDKIKVWNEGFLEFMGREVIIDYPFWIPKDSFYKEEKKWMLSVQDIEEAERAYIEETKRNTNQ